MGHSVTHDAHPSLDWATHTLAADGATVTQVTLVKARAWSKVWRLQTTRGVHYLKACGPGFESEARILPLLADLGAGLVPHVRAVDTHSSWLLLDDAGETLSNHLQNNPWPTLTVLSATLAQYAHLQIAAIAEPSLPALLTDARLSVLPDRVAVLASDEGLLTLGDADAHDLVRFQRAPELCHDLALKLATFGLPDTIDHGDLHVNNIMVANGRARIIDWGDAVFGHPFATLAITLDTTRGWLGASFVEVEPTLQRAYLDPWGLSERPDLHQALQTAIALRPVYGALVWSRGIVAMTDADARQAATWVVTWLRRFVQTSASA